MPETENGNRKFRKDTLKRLFGYIFRYKARAAIVVLFIMVSSATGALASLFLRRLIDDYIIPLLGQANPDFSGLVRVLLIMAGIYLIGVSCTYLYNFFMASIAQGVLRDIRDDMFTHQQTLPIRYFDSNSYGDIMSRFTNDTDTLRQLITQSMPQLFSQVITIISVLTAMLSTSVWLTLFVVVYILALRKIVAMVTGKSRRYMRRQQKLLGELNGYIEEMVNGQKVIKVFCHEEQAIKDFEQGNEELRQNAMLASRYTNILMPILIALGYLLYVVLTIAGSLMAINGVTNVSLTGTGVLTLGMIASFLQLSRNFSGPISHMSQQLNAVISALAGAERIFTLMDETSEDDDGFVTLVNIVYDKDGHIVESEGRTGQWAWKIPNKTGDEQYIPVRGEVRIENVDFGYLPDVPVLHDVSFYAKPGQKVAFVGATGAGKTTITNLINRFYDINDGTILYDGINIKDIKKSDLRRSLGIVLQDVSLFTGTVMENIRYGRLDATDEECIAAAKLANADGFIRSLPHGYDTVLEGDGSGLSQGQRQLISIARAAVADPPVMILDEATSSIDTRTETYVQRGMDSLMQGRTVFVIAHRLSTVKNSNVIIVIDQGRIIERGSHDELIEQKGRYYQLYTGAFELE
ncbi:MAG TPA: ABC transporter ATP-binding protein [Papillibacter sp.]|jgi:ATP-binding cassette subfamily B protein|nr:ABC transporter ATP-binding protein [Papillibacter sp.]